MSVGVELAHGFGDGCFGIPLIQAISKHHNQQVCVATKPHCRDAFKNIPHIEGVIEISEMWDGIDKLSKHGCAPVYQITQNVKFFEYRQHDPEHSLVDTPLWTGRQLGIPDFDQRPIFIPTDREITAAAEYTDRIRKPILAVEQVYNSGQSWADGHAFNMVFDKFSKSHHVIWLSPSGAPPGAANMLSYSRRKLITMFPKCDIFVSVGSGFFCASLSMLQPKRIICLWKDEFYKYENRINQLQWHKDLTWVHNHAELQDCLRNI